jgi:hypothetical protein
MNSQLHEKDSMNTAIGWIGARPLPLQLGAILVVGISGVLMAGLQPLLLGSLVQEGRITVAQLGHAATAELFIMGLASAYAGGRWQPRRLRSIGVISALLLAGLNGLTTMVEGEAVTWVRAFAGIPSGVMIWITILMIARSPTPERWAGIYLSLQTLAQFVMALVLTLWVVADSGANGGFASLAILNGVVAVAALLLPDRFVSLVASRSNADSPNTLGWVALGAPFAWLCCVVGVWVYLEPLARQAGHLSTVASVAVTVSLVCQVLGGIAATLLAGRLRWLPTLVACALLNLVCLLVFAALPRESWFLLVSGVFGFLWLFALPFLVPLVIAADPTRRAAVSIGGAQLLGGSLGPLLASFMVSDTEVRGAIASSVLALTVAMAIALAVHLRLQPKVA